jgi:hypothetical protein
MVRLTKAGKPDGRGLWRKERRDALLINGVRCGESCALCPHDWGQHAHEAPHKCCLCDCVRFTPAGVSHPGEERGGAESWEGDTRAGVVE